MKIRPSISLRGRRLLLVAALTAVASVGAVVAIMVLLSEPAESQPGSPAVRMDQITPLSARGLPTPHPPDTTRQPPKCQAPEDERPAPDLPPLPCHLEGTEPPPGVIAAPEPGDSLAPDNVSAGWQVVDNPMFRYTLAIPPDWYANMRPEGGEFYVLDPVALQEDSTKGVNPPGGVAIHFTAETYSPVDESARDPAYVPDVQRRLNTPNITLGGYPGTVWDAREGDAHIVRAVFVIDSALFQAYAVVEADRPDVEVAGDATVVQQILGTITPY